MDYSLDIISTSDCIKNVHTNCYQEIEIIQENVESCFIQ